jgi:hypothetical protein
MQIERPKIKPPYEWNYFTTTLLTKPLADNPDLQITTSQAIYLRDVFFDTPHGIVNNLAVTFDELGVAAINTQLRLRDTDGLIASTTYRFENGEFTDFTYLLLDKNRRQIVRIDKDKDALSLMPVNPLVAEMGPIFQDLEGESHRNYIGGKTGIKVTGVAKAFDDIFQRHEEIDRQRKQVLKAIGIRG